MKQGQWKAHHRKKQKYPQVESNQWVFGSEKKRKSHISGECSITQCAQLIVLGTNEAAHEETTNWINVFEGHSLIIFIFYRTHLLTCTHVPLVLLVCESTFILESPCVPSVIFTVLLRKTHHESESVSPLTVSSLLTNVQPIALLCLNSWNNSWHRRCEDRSERKTARLMWSFLLQNR